MAAENEATLKLLLEIQEALQKIGVFEARWSGAAKKTAADSAVATKGVAELDTGFGALRDTLGVVGAAAAALGVAKVIQEAVEQVKASVAAAGEAEVAQAKLESVLRATENAIGLSASTLLELATASQRVTGASDEEVQAVERVLIASKKLSGDALPAVLRLSYDLASQMEGGSVQAATLLAKALAEPDRAVETLRRSGILLGKDLDVAVTKLVKTGDTAGAQRAVINALEGSIGGLAAAAGDTLPGALNKLDQAIDDAREKIGAELAVEIRRLAGELEAFVIAHGDDFEKIGAVFGKVANAVVSNIGSLITIYDRFGVQLEELPQLLSPVSAAIAIQNIGSRKLREEFGLSEEAAAKLGTRSKSLAASLELLAAREDAAAAATTAAAAASERAAVAREVEAGKIEAKKINDELEARRKLRDSIEGNTDAISKQAIALRKVLPDLEEHGRLTLATFENAKGAIQDALDQYEKFGIEVPDWLQRVANQFGILTSAQQGFRDSISGNSAALAKQTEDLQVALDAVVGYGELNRHSFENAKAVVQDTLDEYEKFGKKVPDDLAAVAEALGALTTAQQKIRDGIVGNSAALVDQTKNVEAVIAAVEKEGKVTPTIQANIRDELEKLRKQYEEFGQKTPKSLDILIAKYAELESAQRTLADAFAGGDAEKKQQSLREEKDALDETVRALEDKQRATGLALEEENQLWEAKDKLADATRDLNNVTHDLEVSQQAAAASTGALRDDVAKTVDGMGALAETSESAADSLGGIEEAASAFDAVAEKAAKMSKPLAGSVQELEQIEAAYIRIGETHLANIIAKQIEWNRLLAEGGGAPN